MPRPNDNALERPTANWPHPRVRALPAFGYALFAGIFPGQARWDELDAAAKARDGDPPETSAEVKRDA